MSKIVLFIALSMMLFTSHLAHSETLLIENGYVRETIPGTTISSAYMKITNKSEKSVTLVGASSKISPRIEIHQHTMKNGMMRMRQLDSIVIAANETVILQPSGLHLMIFELNKPLKDKTSIQITLQFLAREALTIQLPVQSIKRKQAQHHH